MKSQRNLLLVGMGPYAYVHHLPRIRASASRLVAVVELESEIPRCAAILKQFGYEHCGLLVIPSGSRELRELDDHTKRALDEIIKKKKVSHVIVSTEPKAREAYLDFFVNKKLSCYVDKPLFAFNKPENYISMDVSYRRLLQNLRNNSEFNLYVGLDRRLHAGVARIQSLIRDVSEKYELFPQQIEISSCDGTWNLPNEYLERENHPYKYGYGKLLHSGIHYVDELASYLQVLPAELRHRLNNYDLHVSARYPQDLIENLDHRFLEKVFPQRNFTDHLIKVQNGPYDFGEVDIFSNFTFKSENKKILNATLNLSSTGFSNRHTFDLPWNAYLKSGRVRHDSINVQLGPLMNIKLLEFQLYKELDGNQIKSGAPVAEILVFRNSKILGGEAFERTSLSEMQGEKRDVLDAFLKDEDPGFGLADLGLGMNFLCNSFAAIRAEKTGAGHPYLKNVRMKI